MQETPSSLTMDNPNSKKRNADGEAIGGVHTANDSRKTDSMVPAPGEDDTSQPPLKRRILSPSLPCNQIEGQSPPLSRREVPTSTQECHDGWKTFFEAISPRGKTYDEESGEGKGDAILPSSWNNTPVEEGAKTV
ncbi:uncharacterized protein FPOAC1_013032 [Fusarium poae]|uniref:uncharacterized protein n=1 Tax=Fusarium poae TaxID=36050 RepID=UPI001D04C8BD|nr:uncharacterized protein FPOAC1_013799 [Fusarium poae]XP_044701557.1 uncharacterized protein FPOAC1_013032 [Fusarium poae]KAG8664461.1 hypothetical protein FPOAC1_013799 [Fusarium poae]KAG8665054.1 hypothetical protein FPOAC1_013032 [Fusarium poae]